jgi:hypothetical protein
MTRWYTYKNKEREDRFKMKLAGTKWGANEKILKSVYQGNVHPHLEYGSSSWVTRAKTHHQILDKVQNQALRIITGHLVMCITVYVINCDIWSLYHVTWFLKK